MLVPLLLLFVFFLPFQFALQPMEGVDLAAARVLAVGIFLLWGVDSLFQRRFVVPRPLPFFLFSSFLLWASASFFWAENASWALRKILFLLSFLPLFFVFFASCRKASLREKIFRVFAAGAVFAAAFAIIQFCLQFVFGVEKLFHAWTRSVLPFFLGSAFGESVASYPSLLVNIAGTTVMRASGAFPDPHMAAFFLGMAVPIAFSFAWDNKSGKIRKRWLVCAGVILVADLLTFSRGGYVGLIFGFAAFLLPLLRWEIWGKWALRTGAGIVVVAAVVFASPVGTRLLSSLSQTDASNVERLRLWQEAAEHILNRPIFGTGLGNYPLVVKPSAEYREPIYAHNLFLDIALETGIVGLLFFVLFLCLGILSAWRKWRKDGDTFHLALFSALIIFSVHAIFETPLYSVHALPTFLLLLAASVL